MNVHSGQDTELEAYVSSLGGTGRTGLKKGKEKKKKKTK